MTKNNDDPSENTIEKARRYSAIPSGSNPRQEPRFSNLEDIHEDGYEEPDRDTDFASGYRADSVEDEEEFDEAFSDEEEERDPFPDDNSNTSYDQDRTGAAERDTWLEQEDDLENDLEDDDEDEKDGQTWPLSLIVVAIVALVLLAAGGYGVMQQRAATQEELRELRAALAVAARPEDVGASRGALEKLQLSYDKLAADSQVLTLENRRLTDTVAGLEAQLGVQQSVPTKAVTSAAAQVKPDAAPVASVQQEIAAPDSTAPAAIQAATPRPTAPQPATPQPATTQTVAAASTGPWFVNFGSYAMREMADTWASRLRPVAGKVIVAPNTMDGKTLYRVRVVGLADRDSAQQVARTLEADLRVSQLWVGRE